MDAYFSWGDVARWWQVTGSVHVRERKRERERQRERERERGVEREGQIEG